MQRPSLAWNSRSFCFSLLRAGITGVCHYVCLWLEISFTSWESFRQGPRSTSCVMSTSLYPLAWLGGVWVGIFYLVFLLSPWEPTGEGSSTQDCLWTLIIPPLCKTPPSWISFAFVTLELKGYLAWSNGHSSSSAPNCLKPAMCYGLLL